jgi:hypothetical protein
VSGINLGDQRLREIPVSTLADIDAARLRLAEWHQSDEKAKHLPLGEVNWTYEGDRHVEAIDRFPAIIMGFNAGSGNGATSTRPSRSEVNWRTKCTKLAAEFGDGSNRGRFVLAELILLGSFNQRELYASYGDLEPAFTAGADINLAVIAYHQPRIIFQTGINDRDLTIVARLYGLTFIGSQSRPDHPSHTLLRHYEMEGGTPWLAVMHFARMGFSNKDMEAIQAYARTVVTDE